MKVSEILIESNDTIDNPIGLPPDNLQQIMAHFDKIQHDFALGLVENPKDLSGSQYVQAIHELHGHGKQQVVQIKDLIPIEATLSKQHIDNIIKDNGGKQSSKLPIVYDYQNKLFLVDGNHRVAAAYIDGQYEITVNVISIATIIRYIDLFNKQ